MYLKIPKESANSVVNLFSSMFDYHHSYPFFNNQNKNVNKDKLIL